MTSQAKACHSIGLNFIPLIAGLIGSWAQCDRGHQVHWPLGPETGHPSGLPQSPTCSRHLLSDLERECYPVHEEDPYPVFGY